MSRKQAKNVIWESPGEKFGHENMTSWIFSGLNGDHED